MPESRRFDPLGWFLSTCFALLAGAVALSVAVHLLRSVWPWLLAGFLTVAAIAALIRLAIWWHRGQAW